MSIAALLRPRRDLVFPFTATLFPQLYFVNREVGIATATTDQSSTVIHLQALESAVVAIGVSLAASVIVIVVTRSVWDDSMPAWAEVLLRPSNGALTVFAMLAGALGAYIIAGTLFTLPRWVTVAPAPIGWVLGWPLVAVYAGMVLVGNVLTGEPPLAIQFAVLEVGIALATAWMFLLSEWIAAILSRFSRRTAR